MFPSIGNVILLVTTAHPLRQTDISAPAVLCTEATERVEKAKYSFQFLLNHDVHARFTCVDLCAMQRNNLGIVLENHPVHAIQQGFGKVVDVWLLNWLLKAL